MIGISTWRFTRQGRNISMAVKRAVEMNINLLEMGGGFLYEENIPRTLKKIRKKYPNLKFLVHGYFPPVLKTSHIVNIGSGLTPLNKNILDRMFKAAAILKSEIVSIHMGSQRELHLGENKLEIGKKLGSSNKINAHMNDCLNYGLELSARTGIKFAIENMPDHIEPIIHTYFEYLEIFERFPQLGFLLDIGHAIESHGDPYWFLKDLSHKIVEIHLHDYDGKKDHCILGKGKGNFEKILSFPIFKKVPIILEYAPEAMEKELIRDIAKVENILK